MTPHQPIALLVELFNLQNSWEIFAWLIALSFSCGWTLGTFATKNYVQEEIDRSLKSIDERLGRMEERMDRHVEQNRKGGSS